MEHFWSKLLEFVVIKSCLIFLSLALIIILASDNFQMWLSLKKKYP